MVILSIECPEELQDRLLRILAPAVHLVGDQRCSIAAAHATTPEGGAGLINFLNVFPYDKVELPGPTSWAEHQGVIQ